MISFCPMAFPERAYPTRKPVRTIPARAGFFAGPVVNVPGYEPDLLNLRANLGRLDDAREKCGPPPTNDNPALKPSGIY